MLFPILLRISKKAYRVPCEFLQILNFVENLPNMYLETNSVILGFESEGMMWEGGVWRQEVGGTCAEKVGDGQFFQTYPGSTFEECQQKCLEHSDCNYASPRPRIWYNPDESRCDIYNTAVRPTGDCGNAAVFGYYPNSNWFHSFIESRSRPIDSEQFSYSKYLVKSFCSSERLCILLHEVKILRQKV